MFTQKLKPKNKLKPKLKTTQTPIKPLKGIKVFVISYMFEKVIKQRDKYKAKFKKTEKSLKDLKIQNRDTQKMLHDACAIITTFENKDSSTYGKLYNCSCGRKNAYTTELFFSRVVKFKDKYNLWGIFTK